MSSDPDSRFGQRVDDAIALFEMRLERGQSSALENAIERYPDAESELRAYALHADRVARYFASLRTAITQPKLPEIDGYEELVEIGRGGMSVVFRARQLDSQRTVAIKLMRDDIGFESSKAGHDLSAEQLRFEAQATLDHPHIVRFYHAGRAKARMFLVMELVVGSSLSELIRTRALTFPDLAHYMLQVSKALAFAHSRGFLHSDVKPSNILIDVKNRAAKLADFGLAVIHTPETSSTAPTLVTGGTRGYLAPELVEGESIAPTMSSDVYSFGVSLFEGLTGTLPSDSKSISAKALNPEVPNVLERICRRCLAKNPKHRYSSMEEVSAAIESLLSESNSAQHFVHMGWMLIGFGVVVAALHCLVNGALHLGAAEAWLWSLFFLPYPILFLVFWRTRLPTQLNSKRAKRELWTIWTGHLIATVLISGMIRVNAESGAQSLLHVYPIYGVVTALCAWVMGASFWKGHYVLACFWSVVAIAALIWPGVAPSLFGLAACTASIAIGAYELHLREERSLERPFNYPNGRKERRSHSLLSEYRRS